MKKPISYFVLFFAIVLVSCGEKPLNKNEDWTATTRESKTIDNITYFFSSDTALSKRHAAIKESQRAVEENLALINETEFTHQMDIEFVASRAEMLKYTGMAAQGMAFPERNTFFTLLKDKNSPIKHEMMHMITMYKWGRPPNSTTWMNEGLATYAGGICSGYSLEEAYRYFVQSEKLIPMEELANNFYRHPEMVAYIQGAFISKYLIDNYGLDKFKHLWKEGFDKLDNVYGFDQKELEHILLNYIKEKYPEDISFDWDRFNKGCV